AAFRLAVIPGRALRRLPVALEDPVAEIALDREDAAEEAAVDQAPQLHQARHEELVLHHTMAHAPAPRRAVERHCVVEAAGGRLLAIDMLAGGDGVDEIG